MSPTADSVFAVSTGTALWRARFVGEPINLNVVNADIRDILKLYYRAVWRELRH